MGMHANEVAALTGQDYLKKIARLTRENSRLQARVDELEKCMPTPRIEDLEKIEQLQEELRVATDSLELIRILSAKP